MCQNEQVKKVRLTESGNVNRRHVPCRPFLQVMGIICLTILSLLNPQVVAKELTPTLTLPFALAADVAVNGTLIGGVSLFKIFSLTSLSGVNVSTPYPSGMTTYSVRSAHPQAALHIAIQSKHAHLQVLWSELEQELGRLAQVATLSIEDRQSLTDYVWNIHRQAYVICEAHRNVCESLLPTVDMGSLSVQWARSQGQWAKAQGLQSDVAVVGKGFAQSVLTLQQAGQLMPKGSGRDCYQDMNEFLAELKKRGWQIDQARYVFDAGGRGLQQIIIEMSRAASGITPELISGRIVMTTSTTGLQYQSFQMDNSGAFRKNVLLNAPQELCPDKTLLKVLL